MGRAGSVFPSVTEMKLGGTEPPFPLRSTETGLMLVPNAVKYRGAAAYSFPFTVTKKTYR